MSDRIEEIRARIVSDIREIKKSHEPMYLKSWGYEWDLLLTGDEAENLLSEIDKLTAEGGENNLAYEHSLGAAKQEIERLNGVVKSQHKQIIAQELIWKSLTSYVVMMNAVNDAMMDAIEGKPVSDFMESFPAVRQAVDLWERAETAERELAVYSVTGTKCVNGNVIVMPVAKWDELHNELLNANLERHDLKRKNAELKRRLEEGK
jgi:hypothetical protein